MKTWLAIIFGAVLSIAMLWWTSLPLGIPGEWTWERAAREPDLLWNLGGGIVAAGLLVAYVLQGWRRLESATTRRWYRFEVGVWLTGLVAFSFVWLWIVQEVAPIKNRLGKSAFVLYFASSSGYFTRARYDEPGAFALLAGYEKLMRQGDVLHTGTHPPGLFLIFHGLIAVCESSPTLSAALDATQPSSFREACDVIATNNLRRANAPPFLPLDRRVLWLATLLVMASAALTVIPLFGLMRRSCETSTAWICASLWPAMPAVAIFIPKSDALFPLIGLTVLWLWLTAWDRRSLSLALLAGAITWLGLLCSLAFLPVLLAAGMLTLGSVLKCSLTPAPREGEAPAEPGSGDTHRHRSSARALPSQQLASHETSFTGSVIGIRRWLCVVAAGIGFATPTFLLWRFAQINLPYVWWLNYQNHAGFYRHYPRTYWKWLLLNPLEVSFAAGWPTTLLALVACWSVIRSLCHRCESNPKSKFITVVGPLVLVWGLLWLTGKNSGEAARIWILFLPWLIWLASIQVESMMLRDSRFDVRQRQAIALLAVQFAVCLLTVARVSGFHPDTG